MDLGRFVNSLVGVILAIALTLLGLRFVLKLFGANASNDFVEWIYRTSGDVLAPFRGIFPQQNVEGGYVLEFSTLFAMLAYTLVALIVGFLLTILLSPLSEDRPKRTK